MSTKERDHLGVCVRIKAGGLRLREGSEQLRLSYRHCRNLVIMSQE